MAKVFTGCLAFLLCSHQCQSVEGNSKHWSQPSLILSSSATGLLREGAWLLYASCLMWDLLNCIWWAYIFWNIIVWSTIFVGKDRWPEWLLRYGNSHTHLLMNWARTSLMWWMLLPVSLSTTQLKPVGYSGYMYTWKVANKVELTGICTWYLQVGTGFSFADDAGYARTEDDVAENLLK